MEPTGSSDGRSPYSPRTFRRPDETEQEWKRRSNREKKARYFARHPERVHAQKNRAYARRAGEIQERRAKNRQNRLPKVSPEELALLRQNIRVAVQQGEIICLECAGRLRRLSNHVQGIHHITEDEYRRKWGYDRTTALCSHEESARVRKTARKRQWGTRLVPFRFGPNRPTEQPADKSRRPEARQKISETLKGITRSQAWKKDAGSVVTDTKIAMARLEGALVEEIAQKLGMSGGTVSLRLRRMGFGGRDIAFDRGAVITGRTVKNLCEDFKKKREEISELLGKDYDWAGGYTSPRNLHRPISIAMARKLLKLREQLRKRERPTDRGRPSKLLPSERAELPAKYRALRSDLEKLRTFLRQESKHGFDRMWTWLCREQRRKHLQQVFFWPSFYRWVDREYGLAPDAFFTADWIPSELAMDFLSEEFGVSRRTLKSVVFGAG